VLWLAITALVVAIAVNCAAVWAQKRHRFYDRRFGRYAWPAHIALLVLVWGAAIAAIVALVVVGPEPSWPLPHWVRLPGLAVGVVATTIFGLAIRQLGAQALFNGNFFGHGRPYSHAGMYALLADPMYVGYTLSFVALALREADGVYLLLAAVSYVGFKVEAWFERVEEPDPLPVDQTVD
jgi:protein-S-isoprenylcysteine O-methyltransferase Ste14